MLHCGCGVWIQEGFFCVSCRMNSSDDGFTDRSDETELTPEQLIEIEKKRIKQLEKKAKKKRQDDEDHGR